MSSFYGGGALFNIVPAGGSGTSDYNELKNAPIKNLVGTQDSPIDLTALDNGNYSLIGQFTDDLGEINEFATPTMVTVGKDVDGNKVVTYFYVKDGELQTVVLTEAEDGFIKNQSSVSGDCKFKVIRITYEGYKALGSENIQQDVFYQVGQGYEDLKDVVQQPETGEIVPRTIKLYWRPQEVYLNNICLTNNLEIGRIQAEAREADEEIKADLAEAKETIDKLSTDITGIVSDELAKILIPDDASQALDTLQEIAEWIQRHPEDAAALNKKTNELAESVAAIQSKLEGLVEDTIQDAIDVTVDDAISSVLSDFYVVKNYYDTDDSGYHVVDVGQISPGKLRVKLARNTEGESYECSWGRIKNRIPQ